MIVIDDRDDFGKSNISQMPNTTKRASVFTWMAKKYPAFYKFVKFGIVGASNTAVSLATYYLLVILFKIDTQIGLQVVNLVAFIASVMNSYLWNTVWVFKSEAKKQDKKDKATAPAKFFATYIFTYVLSAVLLVLWTEVLGISEFIAPVLSICITMPINYFALKIWTFRVKK